MGVQLHQRLEAMLDRAYNNAQADAEEHRRHEAELADVRERELAFWNVQGGDAVLVVGDSQEELSRAAQKVAQRRADIETYDREGEV